MGTIRQISGNWDKLVLMKESIGVVVDMTREIIGLNIDQLKHGKKKDGSQVGRYKNPDYADQKFAQNPLAGHGNMDFILTGDFIGGLALQPKPTEFTITSIDNKTSKLIGIANDNGGNGDLVFGLSDESKSYLVHNGFEDKLLDRVHKVTNL